jgi:hypothetical protein
MENNINLKNAKENNLILHCKQGINVREYQRAVKNGQSCETNNIGYTRRRQTKQKHNTLCVGHHYRQTNTYNVNKT